jgi:hypothetical protein
MLKIKWTDGKLPTIQTIEGYEERRRRFYVQTMLYRSDHSEVYKF